MRISIVFTEGAKQIMMTPETDHEKKALAMISPEDVMKVVARRGSFGSDYLKHAGFQIAGCVGGYYRAFETAESLMFVIEDEVKTLTKE